MNTEIQTEIKVLQTVLDYCKAGDNFINQKENPDIINYIFRANGWIVNERYLMIGIDDEGSGISQKIHDLPMYEIKTYIKGEDSPFEIVNRNGMLICTYHKFKYFFGDDDCRLMICVARKFF
jgi:hypothetical protein